MIIGKKKQGTCDEMTHTNVIMNTEIRCYLWKILKNMYPYYYLPHVKMVGWCYAEVKDVHRKLYLFPLGVDLAVPP